LGNVYLRSLLIECANHILRPHRRDSALRQWGLHLASRGGKQARNKAPNGTELAVRQLIRVRIETRWRATCSATNQDNNKSKCSMNGKQKNRH
jgi:hypothetical protein